MGNASNPIRNLDKRTARREYASDFKSSIKLYINDYTAADGGSKSSSTVATSIDTNAISVCVRKRPLFKHEAAVGEFDVISCHHNDTVIVHDARMHPNMKDMFMNHHEFKFDHVFNETTTNEKVFDECVSTSIESSISRGYLNTILVYGQTGSGKTYTMSSIYDNAAYRIFELIDISCHTVSLSFVELCGESAYDMLNKFTACQLLTGCNGSVHAYPVVEPVVRSAEELIDIIHHGIRVRHSSATGVHDSSSRSHAILRIYINRTDQTSSPSSSAGTGAGTSSGNVDEYEERVLTFCDLAGSEHRIDSMYHNADRRKETSKINSSLMALKDCIRAKSMGQINASNSYLFRKSKLTLMLKSSFTFANATTTFLACVSPASKDTEHSLNTLRHAKLIDGDDSNNTNTAAAVIDAGKDEETRFVVGGNVTKTHVGTVNVSKISKQNKAHGTKELLTSNGNEKCRVNDREPDEMSEKERDRIRIATERASMQQMRHRKVLLEARSRFGTDTNQQMRLRRVSTTVVEGSDTEYAGNSNSSSSSSSSSDNTEYDDVGNAQSSSSQKRVYTDSDVRKTSFKKLYKSVFSGSETTPIDLLRRQLVMLLKTNNYTDAEIKALRTRTNDFSHISGLDSSSNMSSGSGSVSYGDRGTAVSTGDADGVGAACWDSSDLRSHTAPTVTSNSSSSKSGIALATNAGTSRVTSSSSSSSGGSRIATARERLDRELEKRHERQRAAKEFKAAACTQSSTASSVPVTPMTTSSSSTLIVARTKLENEYQVKQERQVKAKQRVKELEAQRIEMINKKLVSKGMMPVQPTPSSTTTATTATATVEMSGVPMSLDQVRNEISSLEYEASVCTSSSTKFAIRKRISALHCMLLST